MIAFLGPPGAPPDRILLSPFASTGSTQQLTDPSTIHTARGDHPIIDDDATVTTANRHAVQDTSANQARQSVTVSASGRTLELGGIEVREADLDPGRRVGAGTDTQAVAIPDVADQIGEGRARAVGQPSFARIRMGDRRSENEAAEDQEPFHGPSLRPSLPVANGRWREKGRAGAAAPIGGEQPRSPAMRPLPSSTPSPLDRRPADLFGLPPGLEQEMDDATLLSLLMTRTMLERDIAQAAATLLAVFGSVAAVVAADPHELARAAGLGATTITDLKMLRRLSVRLARSEACRRPVLSSWSALVAYVRSALAHEPREQFRTLYLDKKNKLLRDELCAEGTVDHAPVYPREVVRRALELDDRAPAGFPRRPDARRAAYGRVRPVPGRGQPREPLDAPRLTGLLRRPGVRGAGLDDARDLHGQDEPEAAR